MPRLTAVQKKEIVARYINGESKSNLAKSFNVSHTAISKILSSDKISDSFKNADIETTLSMISYIESKKRNVQSLMNELLNGLKEKMKRASFKDCVTAFKSFADLYIEREKNNTFGSSEANSTKIEFVFTDTSINKDENNDT